MGVVVVVACVVITAACMAIGATRARSFTRAWPEVFDMVGLPTWLGSTVVLGLWAVCFGGVGLYWDAARHVAFGLDEDSLSVPHLVILLANALGIVAAQVGIELAPAPAPRELRLLRLLAAAAALGYPIDAAWHAAMGSELTVWSPPHLVMLVSSSVSPVLLFVLVARTPNEHRVGRALSLHVCAVAMLAGCTSPLVEFSFGFSGFPWIAAATVLAGGMSYAMALARQHVGPGGALVPAVVLQVIYAALGVATDLPRPTFPALVPISLAVELLWLVRRRAPRATAVLTPLTVTVLACAAVDEWNGGAPVVSADGRTAALLIVTTLAATAGWLYATWLDAPVLSYLFGAAVGGGVAVTVLSTVVLPPSLEDGTLSIRLLEGGTGGKLFVTGPAVAKWRTSEVVAWGGNGLVRRPVSVVGATARSEGFPVGGRWRTLLRVERDGRIFAVELGASRGPGFRAVPLRAEDPFTRSPYPLRTVPLLLPFAYAALLAVMAAAATWYARLSVRSPVASG